MDHLGSVSSICTAAAVCSGQSFGAFGERRSAGDWQSTSGVDQLLSNLRSIALTEGYTGHEMDDDLGLINMNGRIYDSAVGRFISADIFVQATNNSQSYNRYTYVFNNPLSKTDPSGYIATEEIARAVAAIVVGFATQNWVVSAKIFGGSGFTAAVIGGFTSGLVASNGCLLYTSDAADE